MSSESSIMGPSAPVSDATDLRVLFEPQSIAVVGASTDPQKPGSLVVSSLIAQGFAGDIYPINPRAGLVHGIPAAPRLSELPDVPDVVFVAIPARQVPSVVREAGDLGIAVAIVGASGFQESGTEEGVELQRELVEASRATGIRVVGPNCNGIYNACHALSLGYNSAHQLSIPRGPVGIVSHSGALFSIFAERLRREAIGLSSFVSVGNEADLDVCDFLSHLVEDDDTKVLAVVLESVPDPRRFLEIAHLARQRGKPMFVLKLGASAEGARATAAHSSRLAGDRRAYESLLWQAGVGVVPTPEALIAAASLAMRIGSPLKGGLACMTTSGAGGALCADVAERHGVPLARVGEATLDAVGSLGGLGLPTHPFDLGTVGGFSAAEAVLELLRCDDAVGATVVYSHIALDLESRVLLARAIGREHDRGAMPVVWLAPGGRSTEEIEALGDCSVPVFEDTETCFAAISAAIQVNIPSDPGNSAEPLPVALPTAVPSDTLDELTSAALLREAGIKCVRSFEVPSPSATHDVLEAIGTLPVVVKLVPPGLAHKADLGLVRVGLSDPEEIARVVDEFHRRASEPRLQGSRVVLQPQVTGDIEAVVGCSYQPGFGHVVVAGSGGRFTEDLDDVAAWVVPFGRDEVQRGLGTTRLGAVLASPRWPTSSAVREALVDVVMTVQGIALAHGPAISAIDINPIILGVDGAIAVDALVVLGDGRPHGALAESDRTA